MTPQVVPEARPEESVQSLNRRVEPAIENATNTYVDTHRNVVNGEMGAQLTEV